MEPPSPSTSSLLLALYGWSQSVWDSEIEADFPLLASLNNRTASLAVKFLTGLERGDRPQAARAMAKRFHPQAISILESPPTSQDQGWIDRWDEWRRGQELLFLPDVPVAGSEVHDQRATIRVLKEELSPLGRVENRGSTEWQYRQLVAGWLVSTHIDVGGRRRALTYDHDFSIPGERPAVRFVSVLSLLGVTSTTRLSLVGPGAEPRAAGLVVDLSMRLFGDLRTMMKVD